MYKENILYFLYRKCRLDFKLEDVIGLELMEMLMFERKINVYYDDIDGKFMFVYFNIKIFERYLNVIVF